MMELKNKLENEDLLRVLKFCKENKVEMNFNVRVPEGAVCMKIYNRGTIVYDYIFYGDYLEKLQPNIVGMFLERANDEFHPVPDPDPDIYNGSGETHIVCYDYLDGDERYRYVVMSIEGRHPTVYIQIPGIEQVTSYNDIVSPDVHGGFTFLGELEFLPGEGIWLGWDYAHCGDYIARCSNQYFLGEHAWTKKELVDKAVATLTQIRDIGLVLNATIGRAE